MYKIVLTCMLVSLIIRPGYGQSTENTSASSDSKPISHFKSIDEKIPFGDQNPGFFLDDWQPRQIINPHYIEKNKPSGILDARIQVDINNVLTKVPKAIYGNNANPYNGQMANYPTLIKYLTDLKPHLIRFPGGNLSNLYYWNRAPGNYPANAPPADSLLDADGNLLNGQHYWYGKDNANSHMSLVNYYKLLDKTNSNGVITVNFAYARYGEDDNPVAVAAGYAADWVRYDNGRTKYWEIGNENYGDWQTGYRIDTTKALNNQPEFISGKLYGKFSNVFIDSMRAAAQQVGSDIKIGVQLIEHKSDSLGTDIIKNWNKGYFKTSGGKADYYIVHNYYTPYKQNSPPSVILNSATASTKKVMQWMDKTIKANNAERKPIALTEWNIFATGSQQKVSNITGVHAAMVLGNLIKYKYGMACRWDLANAWDRGNDHGMFNSYHSPAPDAPIWNPRPAFYYMYYFQKYFGDRMVWSGTQGDTSLKSYASTFSSGQVGLVVANSSDSTRVFDVQFKNSGPAARYYWYTLSGGYTNSRYSRNVKINGQGSPHHPGGPSNYASIKAYSAPTAGNKGIKIAAPPYSVSYMLIDH